MSIQTWFRQPTTIHGLAVLGAAVAGAAEHYFTGDMTLSAGSGAVVYAGVHLITDDNTASGAARMLATDAMDAVIGRHVREQLPKLLTDTTAVMTALNRPTPIEASPDAGVSGARASVAGLLGLLLVGAGLSGCAGQTPAQTACQADLLLQPLAVEAAAPVGGAVGGPGAAATAQLLVTLDGPLHAKILQDCAGILPTPPAASPTPAPAAH